jgi:hypothetical protein
VTASIFCLTKHISKGNGMKVLRFVLFGIAFFLLSSPAFAEFDCTSKAFAAHIDDAKFACKEAQKSNIADFGGISIRTLVDKNDFTADIAQAAVTEKVKAALQAMAAIPAGMPLKIDNVTIVLLREGAKNPVDTKSGQVLGIATKYEGDCILALYPSRLIGHPKSVADELGFTTAHELFHCVQHATWPELLKTHELHPWVIEGTAETVAQAVFPNVTEALQEGFNFSDQFRSKPLTQLTYPNLVFFSWVWGKSPALMFKILSAIPANGDESAQQKALMTVVAPADLSQFVRDFMDGKVHTPGGADPMFGEIPLTMQTNIGLVQFDRGQTREIASQPFTLFALDAQFSGGTYDVNFENLGDIDWQYRQMQPRANSQDLDAKGDWTTGDLTTKSDCATVDHYRFAGMATGKAKLRVTAKTNEQGGGDCKSCGATAARDQCLVGTWMIDNARMGLSIAQYMSGDHAVGAAVAGRNAIKFDEAGQSVWGYQNFKIGVLDGVAGTPPAIAIISGTIDQGWSASKGRLNTCFGSADAKMQIQIAGNAGDIVDFNDLPRQDYEQYSYNCQEDGTLLIEKNLSGKPFLMRLHKLD